MSVTYFVELIKFDITDVLCTLLLLYFIPFPLQKILSKIVFIFKLKDLIKSFFKSANKRKSKQSRNEKLNDNKSE